MIFGEHKLLKCNSLQDIIDKREQRKIRNREAAQISRLRRKEVLFFSLNFTFMLQMVDVMKSQLDACRFENEKLRSMNAAFQDRIETLQREVSLLVFV